MLSSEVNPFSSESVLDLVESSGAEAGGEGSGDIWNSD